MFFDRKIGQVNDFMNLTSRRTIHPLLSLPSPFLPEENAKTLTSIFKWKRNTAIYILFNSLRTASSVKLEESLEVTQVEYEKEPRRRRKKEKEEEEGGKERRGRQNDYSA